MKNKFLAAYEYGSGAVWIVIHANSFDDVKTLYPDLRLIDPKPDWLTDEKLAEINPRFVDIHDVDNKFLSALRREKESLSCS